VARAYLDQLARSNALPEKRVSELKKQMERAEKSKMNKKQAAKLNSMAADIESDVAKSSDPGDAKRAAALAEILKHPVQ
jgi:hypothetical protein